MAALDDVRILDLTRLLPGGYCTQLLADLGADVIKVEDTGAGDYLRRMPPLDGDTSVMFRALNRNKRSAVLDLKQEAGRSAFLALVRHADVVVEGFRPGVMGRLGIDHPALLAVNPAIILCSITGYGQDGPYRDRAGHDINYAALSGALSLNGCAATTLAVPGVQAGDLGGGALHAAVAILAALHQRARTGRGVHCDISMLDGLAAWMAPAIAYAGADGDASAPRSTVLTGRHPCYRVYACADGHMSLGALEPKFWAAFVQAIDRPHLEAEQFADGADADRVGAEVERVLRTRTRGEWQAFFAGRDVCCEPVLHPDEVLQHEQARHRALDVGDGVACPVRLDGKLPERRRSAPEHGGDTRPVLRHAGLSDANVDALFATGAAR